MGEHVEQFEKEAASYLGVKYALGCANGTDALVLGLKAAGVGPGDEVLTTGFTFFATVEAIFMWALPLYWWILMPVHLTSIPLSLSVR